MATGWLGAAGTVSSVFSPVSGSVVALAGGLHIGYTIGSECYKYAIFCDEKGISKMPFLK